MPVSFRLTAPKTQRASTPELRTFSHPVFERYAAVREVVESIVIGGQNKARPTGQTYLDLSTLSDASDGSRRLAERRDRQNEKAIRCGVARPFLRVARVRIKEAR